MTLLIQMTKDQQEFFTRQVLPPFEKKNRVAIELVTVPGVDSIGAYCEKYEKEAYLVKVPFLKAWSLVQADLVAPLNSFLSDEAVTAFRDTYILTWFGEKEGNQYFLPRKFETRIMVYRKSKVRDAVAVWQKYRDTIQTVLRAVNGYGLPRNYNLESDPALWDFFDVFVAGFVWSSLSYDTKKTGRVAHRGKRYSGTALRVIDRVYQCGGDSTAMLRMYGDAVVDAFAWEAVYTFCNIYNKKMFTEQWEGKNLWEGFASNEVFLSFMTQLDCFYLYGSDGGSLAGLVDDTGDIGLSLMPTGCSVQLDKDGRMLRIGTKAITTGGWWWAIPQTCPRPDLAYELFLHITSRENQLAECKSFGMIPVRNDILKSKDILFTHTRASEVFQTSYKQIQKNNNNILPSLPRFDKVVAIYLEAWFDIVAGANWSAEKGKPPDHAHIANTISEKYSRKVNTLLRK